MELETGAEYLRRRTFIGNRCLAIAYDGPWTALQEVPEPDRESYASDAISDILTALYGPPGTQALEDASVLLERALRSYEGDAEDYEEEAAAEVA